MPTVSVVIPTYNREQLVTLTIDSILRQTYKDFEVIVVDDGSTDSTPKVLQSYGDRIRAIRQDNTGVSGAINTGIKAAQGEWIGIVGSDDEWMPEYLEWQMNRVRLYPDVICHITNSVTILPNKAEEDHFQGTGLSDVYKKKDACVILE
jgi:glycosyltransferase involved in cell wall biosynthesis